MSEAWQRVVTKINMTAITITIYIYIYIYITTFTDAVSPSN